MSARLTPERADILLKGAKPVNDVIMDTPKGKKRSFLLANKQQKGITVKLPVTDAGEIDMERLCK